MSHFDEAGIMYADAFAAMHTACFDKAWDKSTFLSLLMLPTTRGFINSDCFILCSVCGTEAEILTLGVLPNARQKGLGTALLAHTMAYLKRLGVQDLFLDVDVKNTPARALYEKSGFVQVGCRPNYYVSGAEKSDALVLKKKL